MKKQHVLLPLFVAVVVIGILHHLALARFWYWTTWWFDVVMHILGGIILGLAVIWLLALFRTLGKRSPSFVFMLLIATVFVVGVGWEVFEFSAQLFVQGNFFPDTLHDISADIAGGLIAYAYYYGVRYMALTQHEQV